MINTSTKIKNLEDEFFSQTKKDGKKYDITVGDVVVNEVNRASGLELKVTWYLMNLFSKDNSEVTLNKEQTEQLKKVMEDAAKRPFEDRYNLTIYGRIVDYLDNPKSIPDDCKPKKKGK